MLYFPKNQNKMSFDPIRGCFFLRGNFHNAHNHKALKSSQSSCKFISLVWRCLTHWGRVRHICVSKLTIIGSDNGFSPGRRQAIIWTKAGLLLIGPLGTNFSEILIKILTFSFKKMHLKVSSAKRRPFCLGLNVLKFPHAITPVLFAPGYKRRAYGLTHWPWRDVVANQHVLISEHILLP